MDDLADHQWNLMKRNTSSEALLSNVWILLAILPTLLDDKILQFHGKRLFDKCESGEESWLLSCTDIEWKVMSTQHSETKPNDQTAQLKVDHIKPRKFPLHVKNPALCDPQVTGSQLLSVALCYW